MTIYREPIDALLAADHPLAKCTHLTLKDLADMPFILCGECFTLNPITLRACRESGFTPKAASQSTRIDLIIELVAAKLGIALLPHLIAEQQPHPMTKRIAIDHPTIYWRLALIWQRDAGSSGMAGLGQHARSRC